MKKVVLFCLSFFLVYANDIKPTYTLQASGGVRDMVLKDNKLYVATDASCVDIFDITTQKKLSSVCVSKIKDFMGDEIDSKIYSIDLLDGALLILSQDNGGYRRVDIFKDGILKHIITKEDHLYISKAKFIDKNTMILGLLSNIIISYDIKTKKENWEVQPTESKFSDFVLNDTKTKVATTDESGDVEIVALQDGTLLKKLSGLNVDNVFELDWKKDIIITAGQDRRCGIYNLKSDQKYYKQGSFLIYSVGLSSDAKKAGYANDEQNDVTIFNVVTKEDMVRLVGNKATISRIVFVDNNHVFVSTDDNEINFYQF